MCVSGVHGLAEREEGCYCTAELFPEVTVKTAAGGSELVLSQSLSDKTSLSLQVKR